MYLWYVYACVCGCDLPLVNNQELGTNNYSVREPLCPSILDEFVGAVEHHAQARRRLAEEVRLHF